jgi:ferrous iron transport protein A
MPTSSESPHVTLADLRPGQRARIVGFADLGPVGQRILQLGLLPEEEIQLVRRAPAGDPLEVKVLGYSLSLRRQEAGLVEVEGLP